LQEKVDHFLLAFAEMITVYTHLDEESF